MGTRGDFLKKTALAAAGVPFLTGVSHGKRAGASGSSNTPADGRPNVLFIITDDQPPHTVYRMQKTLSCFSDGLNLTRTAYASIPLCGPARASLLTGVYPHTHGVVTNIEPITFDAYRNRGLHDDDLLSRLDRVGYDVGFFGKFLNGYGTSLDPTRGNFVHPGADRWQALVGSQYTNPYVVNKDGQITDGVRRNHTLYFSGLAETFMENRRQSPAAWFCYLNLTDPHGPYTPLKAFRDPNSERYVSPGTKETNFGDKSSFWRDGQRHGPAYHQEVYEGTVEELQGVDSQVDRLFTMLERTGQLDDTLVIFSSDNGFMTGQHGGMTSKAVPYEESARVPFLVRGTGIPSGMRPDRLVSHLDITATVLAAAQAKTGGIDGRDLRGIDGQNWRRRLLAEHPNDGWAMVRQRFAGSDVAYLNFGPAGAELYDLANDPYQTRSLHRDPDRAGQMSDLKERLKTLKTVTSGALRSAEEAP